jgi:quercetin dioxygenase-like cupin family protein
VDATADRLGAHAVLREDGAHGTCPPAYAPWSAGYRRTPTIDERAGAVHLGLTRCALDEGGLVEEHLHAYEETVFVLGGELELASDGGARRLGAGGYALLAPGARHAWRNVGSGAARWVELAFPRPRPAGGMPDTVFCGNSDLSAPLAAALGGAAAPTPVVGCVGATLPGGLELAGLGADVAGIQIEMLVDAAAGAAQSTLFVVEYAPGTTLALHDHPYEEAYVILEGAVEAEVDGQMHRLTAGDVLWIGVGSIHGFANRDDVPVRWLEAQAPQPPARHATRFRHAWASVAEAAAGPAAPASRA